MFFFEKKNQKTFIRLRWCHTGHGTNRGARPEKTECDSPAARNPALDGGGPAAILRLMSEPPSRPRPPPRRTERAEAALAERRAREAEALRENLRRRKQQARERDAADRTDDTWVRGQRE